VGIITNFSFRSFFPKHLKLYNVQILSFYFLCSTKNYHFNLPNFSSYFDSVVIQAAGIALVPRKPGTGSKM